MKITNKDLKVGDEYLRSKPDQFGTLHERMKFLISLVEGEKHKCVPHEVLVAIYDLETEVKYTPPASPPFGKRVFTSEQLWRRKLK